jgi:hypothetical protein
VWLTHTHDEVCAIQSDVSLGRSYIRVVYTGQCHRNPLYNVLAGALSFLLFPLQSEQSAPPSSQSKVRPPIQPGKIPLHTLLSKMIFPFTKVVAQRGVPSERNYATLGGHLREANRIDERRSQPLEIFLSHPTGDRARASDIHRYLEVPYLLH